MLAALAQELFTLTIAAVSFAKYSDSFHALHRFVVALLLLACLCEPCAKIEHLSCLRRAGCCARK